MNIKYKSKKTKDIRLVQNLLKGEVFRHKKEHLDEYAEVDNCIYAVISLNMQYLDVSIRDVNRYLASVVVLNVTYNSLGLLPLNSEVEVLKH